MTSTSDLNIAGSPIYESLVATTGDPYQPPAYQLPDVYGSGAQVASYGDGSGGGANGAGPGWDSGAQWGGVGGGLPPNAGPAMLSQFLGRMLGDGQSWVAVMIFGGPIADQLRQNQFMQQFGANPQYGPPGASGYANVPGYGFGGGFGYGSNNAGGMTEGAMAQAYQQAYQWAAQQQAALAASQYEPALPALPPAPDPAMVPGLGAPPALPPAEATQTYGGMLSDDWAGWLGQTAQGARPQNEEAMDEPPYDAGGGGWSSRLGAAMRELRGR